MTLGDGIFYSTILVLIAAAIYVVSVRRKWLLVGKVLGAVVIVGTLLGTGIWFWDQHQRPEKLVPVNGFAGLSFGAKPVDVTLLLGKPTDQKENVMVFGDPDDGTVVMFDEEDKGVRTICRTGGLEPLLGITRYDDEAFVVRTLGEPTHVSVDASGLKKLISYSPLNVTYQMEKGRVTMVCAATGKGLQFNDEYSDPSASKKPDTPTPPAAKSRPR